MAAAQGPVNHLDRLPDELILEIIEQQFLSVRDLISLARTSRRHYRITISPAYKAHVERHNGLSIYWAIQNDQYGTLERLVENGVDVNVELDKNGNRVTVGYRLDGLDAVSGLHRTKAYMKNGLKAEVTPLTWAASLGKDSMVEYLLDHGAYIDWQSGNLCDCCSELLCCADKPPDLPIFSEDFTYNSPFWAPLHYAICKNHTSTAQLLLERGADASGIIGDEDATALHVATRWEMDEIIDYLMDNNLVDINAQNCNGVTALHVAYIAGRYDLVDKYLDSGADINLAYDQETGPWTIFSLACAEGEFDLALQYLRRGADPHFVLEDSIDEGRYTVMRLIYHNIPDKDDGYLDRRIELEQEIIAADRTSPKDM